MACFTLLHAHLATSLRRVHPTAIGLKPPSFFPRASKVAQKKKCLAGGVTFPSNTKLTNLVKACNRRFPPSPAAAPIKVLQVLGVKAIWPCSRGTRE